MAGSAVVVALILTIVPPAAATTGGCPQYSGLLARSGLPVATFSRIMWRESRCNAAAVSRSGDYGLLQINRVHLRPGGVAAGLSGRALLNPATNVLVAARLYRRAGLRPWRL